MAMPSAWNEEAVLEADYFVADARLAWSRGSFMLNSRPVEELNTLARESTGPICINPHSRKGGNGGRCPESRQLSVGIGEFGIYKLDRKDKHDTSRVDNQSIRYGLWEVRVNIKQ